MANSSVKTDSENIISLLLVNINRPKELELFLTDENFTPDSLESKFLAEAKQVKQRMLLACFTHN